jgi:RNA polymerase sigma-70 factor (ECF subfamily)
MWLGYGGLSRGANKVKTFRVYPLGECMLEVLSVVQTPDETLVWQAREGDRSAREVLFHRHRSESYRCAYRLLGHEQDAQDVVQEAMFKAFLALADFDGRSGFRTWLLRIVTNTAYDWGRRRKRRPGGRGGDEPTGHEPASNEDPGRHLHQQDQRREIDQALSRLSATLRETFILFAELGLSYKEIAETQDVPIGTVMSRIYAAREKLKADLDWDKLNGL